MIIKVISDKHTHTQVKNAQMMSTYSWYDVARLIAKSTGTDISEIMGLEIDANNVKVKYKMPCTSIPM